MILVGFFWLRGRRGSQAFVIQHAAEPPVLGQDGVQLRPDFGDRPGPPAWAPGCVVIPPCRHCYTDRIS